MPLIKTATLTVRVNEPVILNGEDVTNLSDVDSGGFLALSVSVPQLRHRRDRVQSGILRQSEWDDLQGLSVRTETVLLHSYREKYNMVKRV